MNSSFSKNILSNWIVDSKRSFGGLVPAGGDLQGILNILGIVKN